MIAHSGDPWLHGHLDRLIDADDAFVWPAEFEQVAHEVALTFERLGVRALPAVAAA